MRAINLALIGSGGMGWRHLQGLSELQPVRKGMITLEAVVDPDRDRRERLADEAERLLGRPPPQGLRTKRGVRVGDGGDVDRLDASGRDEGVQVLIRGSLFGRAR